MLLLWSSDARHTPSFLKRVTYIIGAWYPFGCAVMKCNVVYFSRPVVFPQICPNAVLSIGYHTAYQPYHVTDVEIVNGSIIDPLSLSLSLSLTHSLLPSPASCACSEHEWWASGEPHRPVHLCHRHERQPAWVQEPGLQWLCRRGLQAR